MKQFIVGRISTGSLVNISAVYPDESRVDAALVKSNVSRTRGIDESDLSVLVTTDRTIMDRIQDGSSFDLTFEESQLVSLDFSPEESKRYIKISTDKNRIAADGSDTAVVTIEVWKPDNSGIASGISVVRFIDVMSSFYGSIKYRIEIQSGVASIPFSTTVPGVWTFPANPRRYEDLRVNGQATIISYLG